MHLQSAVVTELTCISSSYSFLDHFYNLVMNLGRAMPKPFYALPTTVLVMLAVFVKGG